MREDCLAVGGHSTTLNSSRHKAAVQKRLDLKAQCEDFHNMLPATYLDSLVKFFGDYNVRWQRTAVAGNVLLEMCIIIGVYSFAGNVLLPLSLATYCLKCV
jgi:hypothetical protein